MIRCAPECIDSLLEVTDWYFSFNYRPAENYSDGLVPYVIMTIKKKKDFMLRNFFGKEWLRRFSCNSDEEWVVELVIDDEEKN